MRLKLGVYYNQFVPKYTKFVRSELKKNSSHKIRNRMPSPSWYPLL